MEDARANTASSGVEFDKAADPRGKSAAASFRAASNLLRRINRAVVPVRILARAFGGLSYDLIRSGVRNPCYCAELHGG